MTEGLFGEEPGFFVDPDMVDAAEQTDIVSELRMQLLSLETALAATERVLQPSLVEFLR